jgi:hypothetical protein
MKKILLCGSVVAVFLMLMTPSIPAIHFSIVEETSDPEVQLLNNLKREITQIKFNMSQMVEKIKDYDNIKVFNVQRIVLYITNIFNVSLKKVDTILSMPFVMKLSLNQTPILDLLILLWGLLGAGFGFIAALLAYIGLNELALFFSLLAAGCGVIVATLALIKWYLMQGLTEPKMDCNL